MSSRQLFKLFRSNLVHKDATYRLGLNVVGSRVYMLSDVYKDLNDRFEYNSAPILAPFHWIAPIHVCDDSRLIDLETGFQLDTFEIARFYPIHKVLNGALTRMLPIGPEVANALEHRTAAVTSHGLALRIIADRYKTPELCMLAVKQNGMALEFVQVDLQTYAMRKTALAMDGMALQFLRDPAFELCVHAVRQNGCAMEFVPAHKQTGELCRLAIQQDASAIEFVKEPTRELKEYAEEQQYIQFTRSRG